MKRSSGIHRSISAGLDQVLDHAGDSFRFVNEHMPGFIGNDSHADCDEYLRSQLTAGALGDVEESYKLFN